jgi:hypothetical protein
MADDIVVDEILRLGLSLTKERYRVFAWWDANHQIEGEEWSLLPEGYEDWPESDKDIN